MLVVRASAAKAEGLGSIPSGFPGFFISSSWLSNVYGIKTLWCSSTVQLLSTQKCEWGEGLFGCFQHRYS